MTLSIWRESKRNTGRAWMALSQRMFSRSNTMDAQWDGSSGFDGPITRSIGELALIGLGVGTAAIGEFLSQVVFVDSSVDAVIADPEEANVRSLGAFRKAGFTVVGTVQLTGENFRRLVVRMDRPPRV